MAARRVRDVLPIELLNSFDLLANARVEYVDAIVDYNRAQFAMYVAVGQPPANSLAHPVPVEGVSPRNIPPRAMPGPAPAEPNLPAGSTDDSPSTRWRDAARRRAMSSELFFCKEKGQGA